jgi:steroid delta-isomerase-like uncharacterized protein
MKGDTLMATLTANETDLMRDLVDSCDEIIYLKDANGRFIMVNRKAAELAKMSKEALIGKTSYDITTKDEADQITADDRQVAKTGMPKDFTSTVSLPSGRVTVHDHKFPVAVKGYPNAVGGIAIPTMAAEDRKALSRRAMELWSSDTIDTPESIYAKNYVNHQPDDIVGVATRDLDSWKELFTAFGRAFPKATVKIVMQIAQDDRIATFWELTGTHKGEFVGFAATNKKATSTGINIDRFEKGKIVETWVVWDKYSWLKQLGLTE